MTPSVRLMPDGQRLHLQHGPSDLIIWAEGARDAAYSAAARRFETIIGEIVDELAGLREMMSPLSKRPRGAVARRMHDVCVPFASAGHRVTRMAAVAGSVADEVLTVMTSNADITRAYVNNGGDIALYLTPGTSFTTAVKGHDGVDLGRVQITANDGISGIATSGRHGRSLSLGIADSVTVLASSAAGADVAATLIANAVDLPGHPAITRLAACQVESDTDLADLPVVTRCRQLSTRDRVRALSAGRHRALSFQSKGLISSAVLYLQDHVAMTDACVLPASKEYEHVRT